MSQISDNPLRAEKRRKLRALREVGVNPYPYGFKRSHTSREIRERWEARLKLGEHSPKEEKVRLAGRLMTLRAMGKASFFDLQDGAGVIQCYVRVPELAELEAKVFSLTDLGDIVGVEGFVFRTQRGELSIHVEKFWMLTKSLEPLPEKYHGVTDVEIKYRHRHLDLITDLDSKRVFEIRSKVIRTIRDQMESWGFLEVETPMLQPIYGGASAHPFTTQHRALDMKLYLKISPELYLKRLIVGGFEKVFEISKNFRNEGIDRTHNPEFTMMEWYEAYTDYQDQLVRFETLVSSVIQKITGTTKISFQGMELDFSPPWRRLTVYDGVRQYVGIDPEKASSSELATLVKKYNPKYAKDPEALKRLTHGELVMDLFEQVCEKELIQPTFVMDHPIEISPLTKAHRSNPRLVERFEPFAFGMELGNAYTELNDPEDQYARLKEQEQKRAFDEEAHPLDMDFVLTMDMGMPPTGGVGLGIERLVMLITDRPSIRDIILFPTMRPHGQGV